MATDTSGQTQTSDWLSRMGGAPQGLYIDDLKELYRKARSTRERFVPDWYLNLAFYVGYQWVFWNRGRLAQPQIPNWREQIVDNRIQPVVLSRVARMVKNRPAFIATPFTADEADIDAAKVTEKILDNDWVNLDMQRKLFQVLLYSDICGAGFWKIYWDSTKGQRDQFVYDADGNAVLQEDGRPVRAEIFGGQPPEGLFVRSIAAGDVCIDVLSPFEIFPDPLAKSLEECEWVIEEKVRSVEYCRQRFGVELTPDADAPVGPVEQRLYSAQLYSGSDAAEYRGVRVFEYWGRPSTQHPEGKRCVWANEKVLLEEDAPFDDMPYVMFSGVRIPNRFWPTSVATQLRSPQTELNKIESQVLENAKRIGNPALMKSRQANVHYSGVPGEEILYDSTVPDAVPSYLQPPEVPVYVREQIDRITNAISEISGIHEVSNATVPAGVTAASAINLLQEADDTRLGPVIQDMERALSVGGQKIAKLRAQFNTDERLIRIAGEDGNWDIFTFRGEMLGENTNVEVQAGSAMPRSKAAKQAAMVEVLNLALQYGMQLDPRDLRRFFKDYDVAALERLFDTLTQDEQQIQREHRMMSQGIALEINEWDEDAVHLDGHNEYRKTERFARLDPAIQQIINLHVQAHQERMVQVVNLQLQAQGAEQADQAAQDQAVAQAQQAPPQGGGEYG